MDRPNTPPSVISAAQAGSTAAWDQIFREWHRLVLWRCRVLGCGRADPEDVASQVFLRLFEKLPNLRTPAAFPGFILTVTRHVAAEQRRLAWWRRWVGSLEDIPPMAPEDATGSPEDAAQRAETREAVAQALDQISEKYRVVLMLCLGEGYTPTEAAEVLGLSVNTVKTQLQRGKKEFKRVARRKGLEIDDDV